MSCAHGGNHLDCPKEVHLAMSVLPRGENGARTRPDHQTFEAELVRTEENVECCSLQCPSVSLPLLRRYEYEKRVRKNMK